VLRDKVDGEKSTRERSRSRNRKQVDGRSELNQATDQLGSTASASASASASHAMSSAIGITLQKCMSGPLSKLCIVISTCLRQPYTLAKPRLEEALPQCIWARRAGAHDQRTGRGPGPDSAGKYSVGLAAGGRRGRIGREVAMWSSMARLQRQCRVPRVGHEACRTPQDPSSHLLAPAHHSARSWCRRPMFMQAQVEGTGWYKINY